MNNVYFLWCWSIVKGFYLYYYYYFFLNPIYSPLWHTICERVNKYVVRESQNVPIVYVSFVSCLEVPLCGTRSTVGALMKGTETCETYFSAWVWVFIVLRRPELSCFSSLHRRVCSILFSLYVLFVPGLHRLVMVCHRRCRKSGLFLPRI